MTAIQTQLDKATQAVKERLLGEFKLSDIPDIAEMINAIRTVETYAKQFEMPEQEETVEVEEAAPEGIDYLAHARDELEDSEMYYNYWLETHDEALKEIARDELRHSEYWLGRARQENPDSPELAELKTFHNSILAKLI